MEKHFLFCYCFCHWIEISFCVTLVILIFASQLSLSRFFSLAGCYICWFDFCLTLCFHLEMLQVASADLLLGFVHQLKGLGLIQFQLGNCCTTAASFYSFVHTYLWRSAPPSGTSWRLSCFSPDGQPGPSHDAMCIGAEPMRY